MHLAGKLRRADFAITQFFFEVDHYLALVDDLSSSRRRQADRAWHHARHQPGQRQSHGHDVGCRGAVVVDRARRQGSRRRARMPSGSVSRSPPSCARSCSKRAPPDCTSTRSTAAVRPVRSTPSSACRSARDLTYGRAMRAYENIYINGKWVPSNGDGSLEVTNSATEEVIATVPSGTAADVDAAVAAARAAFPAWSELAKEERAAYLMKIHAGLEARTDEIAQTIAQEVGMPLMLSNLIQVGLPKANFAIAAQLLAVVRVRAAGGQLAGRARGHRGRRLHHAVELPVAPDRAEGRAGVGRRQHRGRSSPARWRRSTRSSWPRSSTKPACPPACSTSSPAWARWSARPSPPIPTSTWSASPVPPAPASEWPRSAARQ